MLDQGASPEIEAQRFKSMPEEIAPISFPMPEPGAPSEGLKKRKGRPKGIPESSDQEELWAHFQQNPDFFAAIEIDKNSGKDEVKDLPHPGRYVSAAMGIAFSILNIRNVISTNFVLLNGEENKKGIFCISKTLLKMWFGVRFDIGFILAIVELTYLAFTIFQMIYYLLRVFLNCGEQNKARRWIAFSRFMFSAWPQFANVTAVKLLYYVQVTILIQAVTKAIKMVFSGGFRGCLGLLGFIFVRMFILMLGMDTFLYKAQVLAIRYACYEDPSCAAEPMQTLIIDSVVFILQVLGVIQLGRYARRRIFIFMFAGEDGVFTEKEIAIKTIWEAQFAMWVWQQLSFFQACSVYLSFNDYDFQKLVLDDKSTTEKTGARAGCGWLTNICANLGIAI